MLTEPLPPQNCNCSDSHLHATFPFCRSVLTLLSRRRVQTHASLIQRHMLARKHTYTHARAHTQKQPRPRQNNRSSGGTLIDISAANVDLIFSACWRGTAMENAANQPVNQSNNLFLLRRCRRAFGTLKRQKYRAQQVHQSWRWSRKD